MNNGAESLRSQHTSETQFDVEMDLVLPPHGYGINAVRRLLLTFGRARHAKAIPLSMPFGRAAAADKTKRRDAGNTLKTK